jgi:hypothetical protein
MYVVQNWQRERFTGANMQTFSPVLKCDTCGKIFENYYTPVEHICSKNKESLPTSHNIAMPKLLDQFEVFIKLIGLGDIKAYDEALSLIKQLRQ